MSQANGQAGLESIVAAYNDVSARMKQAYEQLAGEVSRLNDELATKNRELARRERLAALGQLAAGLAHEVRNPLGGIALYASMLNRDLADRPREVELARKIGGAVRSLDRLVNEILEFAQEDVLERQSTTFGEVLEPALEGLAGWTDGLAIEVEVAADSSGVELWCDVQRMQRVLLNILINASQAMGERGRIEISARARDGAARIEIRDSGPGIAEDRLDKIFDPFFTTRASGTGLGLAIVHRIVEAHGGRVTVRNQVSGGAAFAIELPDRGVDESMGPAAVKLDTVAPASSRGARNRMAS